MSFRRRRRMCGSRGWKVPLPPPPPPARPPTSRAGRPGGAEGPGRVPTRVRPDVARPYEPERPAPPGMEAVEEFARHLPPPEENEPIFAKSGVMTLSWGEVNAVSGPDEDAVVIS